MPHRFDPNVNPYADELLRLSLAPERRFNAPERHLMAAIIGAKLYDLEPHALHARFYAFIYPHAHIIRFASGKADDRHDIAMHVMFESDDMQAPYPDSFVRDEGSTLIVLHVGDHGVIELFNGFMDDNTATVFAQRVARLKSGQELREERHEGSMPPLDDEEARRRWLGLPPVDGPPGNDGNGGGGDGNVPGAGGDGPGDTPGAGGTRELVHHPVLFSVDSDAIDAILEQT